MKKKFQILYRLVSRWLKKKPDFSFQTETSNYKALKSSFLCYSSAAELSGYNGLEKIWSIYVTEIRSLKCWNQTRVRTCLRTASFSPTSGKQFLIYQSVSSWISLNAVEKIEVICCYFYSHQCLHIFCLMQ